LAFGADVVILVEAFASEPAMVKAKALRRKARAKLGGAARKAQLINLLGYMINDKGKEYIQGYHYSLVGNKGGASRKAHLINLLGYMVNEKGIFFYLGVFIHC